MTHSRLQLAILATVLLLVGCDHGAKHLAKRDLQGQGPRPLISGIFDLSYTENWDSGFGLLHRVPEPIRRPILTTLQLVGGAGFLLWALRRSSKGSRRAGLLLLAGGALGNGLDRLARGYVVDFLHLHHWPVFNLADIYITAGAVLLGLAARRDRSTPRAAPTLAQQVTQ
jgi:signal peptidase II